MKNCLIFEQFVLSQFVIVENCCHFKVTHRLYQLAAAIGVAYFVPYLDHNIVTCLFKIALDGISLEYFYFWHFDIQYSLFAISINGLTTYHFVPFRWREWGDLLEGLSDCASIPQICKHFIVYWHINQITKVGFCRSVDSIIGIHCICIEYISKSLKIPICNIWKVTNNIFQLLDILVEEKLCN